MIKHIVIFKLHNFADGKSKSENAQLLKEKLEKLPELIPEIKEYEVGINFNGSERAWDLSLISAFSDEEDLKKYAENQYHLDVVAYVKKVSEATSVVDYQI